MKRLWTDADTGATVKLAPDVHGAEGVWWLTKVCCPPRRQGEGGASRVMQRVCASADRQGVTLRLMVIPKPNTEVTKRRRREWYRLFGFVGTEEMRRIPNAPE